MLLARVKRTVEDRGLLPREARVLVACSGGPDSAALLDVLVRLAPDFGWQLFAASVDHGLREDAARDVALAASLAERLGVPFEGLRVDVPAGASRQRHAREARYEALLSHAASRGASRVAVGHTLDDQAETVLSRLLRGAGVQGLSGIEPRRDDGVVRPLIDARRSEVRAHVDRFSLPHVEDPSNLDPAFQRSRIRHGILPVLLEEDPAVVSHLAALADESRDFAAWASGAAAQALGGGLVPSAAPTELELPEGAPAPVLRAIFARWIEALTGRPAKRAHILELERAAEGAKILLPGGWIAGREGRLLRARHDPEHRTRSRRRDG